MRRLPYRNIMLWLSIVTLLWGSQGYGYVWCVVEDGSTHLESSLEKHCDSPPTTNRADLGAATFGAEDTSCGPCFDLAATLDTLQHRTLSGSDLGGLFLLSTIVRPQWGTPAFVRHLANNLILEAQPRVATTLLVHRTIVLLI